MSVTSQSPKVSLWADMDGAVVIRTHDVDTARAAVRTHLTEDRGITEDEIPDVAWWLDDTPTLEYGRWAFCGAASVEEGARMWSICDGPGPGISRAVVWYDL